MPKSSAPVLQVQELYCIQKGSLSISVSVNCHNFVIAQFTKWKIPFPLVLEEPLGGSTETQAWCHTVFRDDIIMPPAAGGPPIKNLHV